MVLQAEGTVDVMAMSLACSQIRKTSVANMGRERRCAQEGHRGRQAVLSPITCWDKGNVLCLCRLFKSVQMK